MTDAIYSGDYDVFAPPGSRGGLSMERSVWSQQVAQVSGLEMIYRDGKESLFDSVLAYSFGISYQNESYAKDCDAQLADGQMFGIGCGVGSGERKTLAAFFESQLRLDNIEWGTALRIDQHSDFGSAWTLVLM